MNKLAISLLGAALLLTLACGGGGGGTPGVPATRLSYTPPAVANDTWRLELDPASTDTTVLLNLLAPAGTTGNGFTVTLTTVPGQAAWTTVDSTRFAVQTLFATPKVNLAKVSADGRSLRILVGQAPGAPVDYGTTPLAQVALAKSAGATVGAVALTASAAGNLGADPTPVAVTVSVGSLTAQ